MTLRLKTWPLICGTVLLFPYRHISALGSSGYPLLYRSCYKVCLRTVAWGCHTCVPVSFCQYHMSYCNSTTGPILPSLRRLKRGKTRMSSEGQPSAMPRLILGTRKVNFTSARVLNPYPLLLRPKSDQRQTSPVKL